MGLSASQGRLLLLTARQNDLEYQAQQVSHQRLALAAKLDDISQEYENSANNRQMMITMRDNDGTANISNLTYAKLVSGAAALGANATGINQVAGINTTDYSNSQAFRLTDGSSIVVSDISEIPGVKSTKSSSSDGNKDTSSIKNATLYNQVKIEDNTASGGKKTTTTTKYFKISDISNKNSDLVKSIGNDENVAKNCKMVTDGTKFYIRYAGNLYNLDGSLDDTEKSGLHEYKYESDSSNKEATVQFVYSNVPASETITYSKLDEKNVKNNRITVNGQSYLIDKDLADNSSNVNYLQNCLRNGKYIIEKYNADSGAVINEPWKEVSWDSASNISDQYYEADDAAAKAKYDRLTKQVEMQDKKLQLDLDNIETQRDAVKTEIDSVNKVIDNNIEKTFNTFG